MDFDDAWNMQLHHGFDHTCKFMWHCNNVVGLGKHDLSRCFGLMVYCTCDCA